MSQAAIRMSGTNSGESLEAVIIRASQRLGYSSVRDKQLLAIRTFMEANDVFISLPTGSGKSLYYAVFVSCSFKKILPTTQLKLMYWLTIASRTESRLE